MEREGFEEMLRDHDHGETEEKNEFEEKIKQDEEKNNQNPLSLSERLIIKRNKEAAKALLDWRIAHKITEAKHGPLSEEHTIAFLAWAHDNGKIDFSKDTKLENLYTKYVNNPSAPEKTPSVIVDYATHYKIESEKTLVNILKNKKVSKAYDIWIDETSQDKESQLNNKEKTAEFINWAIQNTDIDFSKLLREKDEIPESEDNNIDKKILLKIKLNKELQPLLTEWKKLNTKDSAHPKEFSTKEDIMKFINWTMKEKSLDISGKTYNELDKLTFNLEHGKIEEIPEEEPNIIVDPELYKESAKVEAAKKRIADLPTESDILGPENKAEKLKSHRQQILDLYGVQLDEEGNPATSKDETKIVNMLGLVDEDVKKVQRGGFFGKIKGFFKDLGASEKDKMIAYAFKKDLSEYTHFMLENAQPKYISDGPISRSMIRERGLIGTSNGSVETARHTPLKRAVPKRGRPRKTKA